LQSLRFALGLRGRTSGLPPLLRRGGRIPFWLLRHEGGETGRQNQGSGENHSFHSKKLLRKSLLLF
jgi:hypothetical protein